MTLEQQMRDFCGQNQAPRDNPTWDQMCGSLMFRFNSWRGWVRAPYKAIGTAFIAGSNSAPLNPNAAAAPPGAFHFIAVPGVPAGHVVQDAAGGAWRCLSTGYTAMGEVLGRALGFLRLQSYLDAKRASYRGWATNYAGGLIVPVSATAGGSVSPVPAQTIGDRKMRLAWTTDGTGWLVTEDGWHGLPNMQFYNLFKRLIVSNQGADKPENFLRVEVDMMQGQLALLRIANRVDQQIDAVKLASAISDELQKAGIPVTVENLRDADFTVDVEALGAAFEAAVPRVAKAIVKHAGDALSAIPE